ncbi:MAG: hypothetical protein KGL95_05680 [Patescibacteria group bacterium]|nr:hypothetical protein [Patescibacteria group bacterium]
MLTPEQHRKIGNTLLKKSQGFRRSHKGEHDPYHSSAMLHLLEAQTPGKVSHVHELVFAEAIPDMTQPPIPKVTRRLYDEGFLPDSAITPYIKPPHKNQR